MKVAILDDYQGVALRLADWSAVRRRAEITVFNDHLADPAAVVERLRPFDVVCVMRERTPLSRDILQQLPRLKLIASTGLRNAAIDTRAAAERGIVVMRPAMNLRRPSSTPGLSSSRARATSPAKPPRCAMAAGKRASAQTCGASASA